MKIVTLNDEKNNNNNRSFSISLAARYPDLDIMAKSIGEVTGENLDDGEVSLIVLDTTLTSENILPIIQEIRKHSFALLMILTDVASESEHAAWFDAGADDIVTKPVSLEKLLAKCAAVFRRMKEFESIRMGGCEDSLVINFTSKTVTVCGRRVHLTPIEFSLLSELTKNVGTIVPTETLLERVWGTNYRSDYDLLKASIYRLRNKLSVLGDREKIIKNERGTGYICGIW